MRRQLPPRCTVYYRTKSPERAWVGDHSSDGLHLMGRLVAIDGFAGVASAISDSFARFPSNVGISIDEQIARWPSSEEHRLETKPGVRFVSVTALDDQRWAVKRAYRDGKGFSFQPAIEVPAGDAEQLAAVLRNPGTPTDRRRHRP